MELSISKRKKVGRPRTDATPILLRLPPISLSALDAWIAVQPEPGPSRPEAIRRLLTRALDKPPDAGSIPAEDINASNDE